MSNMHTIAPGVICNGKLLGLVTVENDTNGEPPHRFLRFDRQFMDNAPFLLVSIMIEKVLLTDSISALSNLEEEEEDDDSSALSKLDDDDDDEKDAGGSTTGMEDNDGPSPYVATYR